MKFVRGSKTRGAFIATSFGFGPASKAVTIAREFERRFPDVKLHYFGSGLDREFVVRNGVFDEVHPARTDAESGLAEVLPRLREHDFVVSVLNFDILPMWREIETPLYYVDSLAWMWRSPPAGIESVAAYFVQDFLVDRERVESWRRTCPLVLVPPIMQSLSERMSDDQLGRRENRLVVNFAGCGNPYVGGEVYRKYAITLGAIIVSEAREFDEVQICCNEGLADFLRSSISDRSVKIGHLAHTELLEQLSTSRMLLTSPGITTTLEALRARIPFRFLLPQNDSQAIASEIYRRRAGDDVCMAFSGFGDEFLIDRDAVDLSTPTVAVGRAVQNLERILDTKQDALVSKIRLFLSDPDNTVFGDLFSADVGGVSRGQEKIVEHIARMH